VDRYDAPRNSCQALFSGNTLSRVIAPYVFPKSSSRVFEIKPSSYSHSTQYGTREGTFPTQPLVLSLYSSQAASFAYTEAIPSTAAPMNCLAQGYRMASLQSLPITMKLPAILKGFVISFSSTNKLGLSLCRRMHPVAYVT
jgi:hypothetical protein